MTAAQTTAPATSPATEGTPSTGTSERLGYVGGLDGIRGIALLAMLAGHFYIDSGYRLDWVPGAWLCVSTFFTLSGFLITRLMVHERESSGRVSLKDFWLRRAKRLLPALTIAVLIILTVQMLHVAPAEVDPKAQILSVIFYAKNIHIVWMHGAVGLTTGQMWSLSVEEQFYLLFPLLFLVCRRFGRLWPLLVVSSGLAIASFQWALKVNHSGDWANSYFSTLCRADETLVGVVLGLVTSTAWSRRFLADRRVQRGFQVAALAALVLMGYLWHTAGMYKPNLYAPALANALLTCVVIVACLFAGPISTLLSFRPMAWMGRASYAVYVYHLPLFYALTGARLHIKNVELVQVVRLAVVFSLAALSGRYIEQPIRRWRHGDRSRPTMAFAASTIALVVLTLSLPLPSSRRTIERAMPTGSEWYVANNRLAVSTDKGVSLLGDDTAELAIPGLQALVARDPGSFWVAVHTEPLCPLARSGTLALQGRARNTSVDCFQLHFYRNAALARDQVSKIVVTSSVLDLADAYDPVQKKWRNIGHDLNYFYAQQGALAYLFSAMVSNAPTIDWYLLDPAKAPAQFRAAERRAAELTRATGAAAKSPPPTPSDSELRYRAERFNLLVRRVTAHHHGVALHGSLEASTLDESGWAKLLR